MLKDLAECSSTGRPAPPSRGAAADLTAAPLLHTPIRVTELIRPCLLFCLLHHLVIDRFLHDADLGVDKSPGVHFCVDNRPAFRHRATATAASAQQIAAGVTRSGRLAGVSFGESEN